MNFTRVGIAVFVGAVLAAPLYAVQWYSPVSHLISQLGAQETQNSFVMVAGFLALGAGIVVDGVKNYSKHSLPFIIFGLAMALAGLFPHKPMFVGTPFNELAHNIHGATATVAGIAIATGLIWQGILTNSKKVKITSFTLAALSFLMPMAMLRFPELDGLIQRGMYLFIFTWLWLRFPGKILTKKALREE